MTKTKKMAAVAAVVGGATYAISKWPTMTSWGATYQETEEELPGDEIVGKPRYRTTHAVTIDAPVEKVWPWLVQIGQGRGGLYSYDWLENLVGLHMHSADRIVPELQDLFVGDIIRMVPEGTYPDLRFVVRRLEPPHVLVLGVGESPEQAIESGMAYPCWAFVLRPVAEDRTRLLVRFQSDFKPTPKGWLMNKYGLEPVHFLMERKMLLGIKERAESAAA